jgi:dethiobiotin synthetase
VKLVVVAGTGSEVGKTWLTCKPAVHLRQGGYSVAARQRTWGGSSSRDEADGPKGQLIVGTDEQPSQR